MIYNTDFVIEIPEEVQGLVNLGGIESPGLTSAPAIAQYVVDLLERRGGKASRKKRLAAHPPQAASLPRSDPPGPGAADRQRCAVWAVICRCEMVTEGEIVAEIHAPIPAVTYDAIKRRTWLGTGRCLGGFDLPRVVALLADELSIPPEEVTKKGRGSEFLFRLTKEADPDTQQKR